MSRVRCEFCLISRVSRFCVQAYQFLSGVDPDTTWSLLVEKTCWRMESLMSGAIPINNFFKLMQALGRRTRRGSLRTGSRRWTAALVPTYYHHQFNLSIFHTCGGIFTGNGFFWSLPKSFNHNCHLHSHHCLYYSVL